MHRTVHSRCCRTAHTLMELVAAMVASAFLLAGLGSVMMIGRQVAYTPSASIRRTEAADAVNQVAEELRYATLVIQQTPQILEFVVADRDADGTAEKIRYEWSGTPGDPLVKKVNTAAPVEILDAVEAFAVTFQQKSKTTTLTTTTESTEAVLISNANSPSGSERDISSSRYSAQLINPGAFTTPAPANAVSWNATKVDFQARDNSSSDETLVVQLRSTGEPNDCPTSHAVGQKTVPESAIGGGMAWRTAVFPSPVRDLSLYRRYSLVWGGLGSGDAARLLYNDSAPSGVHESNDGGANWQFMSTRQVFYRLYGTYTTPSTSYNVTRNYVSNVELLLQSGPQSHARIDARIPLSSSPELLSGYWRADFNANPTATNANGDAVADWVLAGGATFNTGTLISGIWYCNGLLETRPLSDFATTTFVDVRCRNSSVGGNGAVVRVNADRQGGLYAPLLVYLQRQSDGTQTLTLHGKTSDALTKQLFTRPRLPGGLVRFRLTILPQQDVVNLHINEEDQGSFVYPTYAPSSTTDRYLTLFADTSSAEFDYVDVRIAN